MRRTSRKALPPARYYYVSPYSQTGWNNVLMLFDIMDNGMERWQRELIYDYGGKAAVEVMRAHPTPARARKELENRFGKPLVPQRKRQ